jgi:phage shock protein PspC (stress-responsive transcriptional regulator)
MNKTENINIGGLIFYIDENAYQELSHYFEAIKRSLTDARGQEEIMKDIEMRVAELLADRQKSDKHVINRVDVDEVIQIMGKPEDYRIDSDEPVYDEPVFEARKHRKLYRDTDHGLIGGVCTGLGHYFGIDPVWLKIILLLLVFGGGSGLLIYLILWIAMPAAVTTTEKLEMTGEPVNISNIEKKVRQEFDHVSDKFKQMDYTKMGNQVKTGTQRFGDGISDLAHTVFSVLAKIIGAVVLFFSAVGFLSICVAGVVMICSSGMANIEAFNYIQTPIGLETPYWVQGILFVLCFGIPLFFMMLLGLRMLNSKLRSMGNIVRFTLVAVWILAVGVSIFFIAREASQMAFEGKDVQKENLTLVASDTLKVRFINNDRFAKNIDEMEDYRLTQDSLDQDIIYSNQITIHFMKTGRKQPYLQIERLAKGKSFKEANQRAEKIQYGFVFRGNELILNNYFTTAISSKFRDQKVDLYLFLPEGTMFKTDATVQNFDQSENDFFNLHFSSDDYLYRVAPDQIKCTNCPENENEYFDVETSEPADPGIPLAPEAPAAPNEARFYRDQQGTLHRK